MTQEINDQLIFDKEPRILNGESIVSTINSAGEMKDEIKPLLTPLTKINSE